MEYQNGQPLLGRAPAGAHGTHLKRISRRQGTVPEELRKSSGVMCRSINAQAEFWMKVGMSAEANPTLSFTEIMARQLKDADVQVPGIEAA